VTGNPSVAVSETVVNCMRLVIDHLCEPVSPVCVSPFVSGQ